MLCSKCDRENPVGAHFCNQCANRLTAASHDPITLSETPHLAESLTVPNFSQASINDGSGDFVGRQRELDHLAAAFDRARSVNGQLVMLVGEPGIGKTRTDREIAYELFISARTVGYHVSNILNKTGVINRTEAAGYAIRHELTKA